MDVRRRVVDGGSAAPDAATVCSGTPPAQKFDSPGGAGKSAATPSQYYVPPGGNSAPGDWAFGLYDVEVDEAFSRIQHYLRYTDVWGLDAGSNLGCASFPPF